MEPSEIVNVLARASELQAKIDAAIGRASRAHPSLPLHPNSELHDDEEEDDQTENEAEGRCGDLPSYPDVQKLTAIRDALLDLQDQLDSLQALQKKQKFEREDHLVELEERRKHLIKRLSEYNGREWEIVQEAHAFVGEPVQGEDDLVLPPYQSSVRDVHALGEGASGHGSSRQRQRSSRKTSSASRPEEEEDEDGKGPKQAQDASQVSHQSDTNKMPSHLMDFSGFMCGLSRLATRAGQVARFSAKTVLVIASIVFTLSQLERKLCADKASHPQQAHGCNHGRRRSNRSSSSADPNSIIIQQDKFCPHGKILLVQDGVQRCLVKERVEAPFKEVIKQPDASYGYG